MFYKGVKMNDLKFASGETAHLDPKAGYFGSYIQIFYDLDTGDVIVREHIGDNYSRFDDPAVIWVCNTQRRMTMKEIAERVLVAIQEHEEELIYQEEQRKLFEAEEARDREEYEQECKQIREQEGYYD